MKSCPPPANAPEPGYALLARLADGKAHERADLAARLALQPSELRRQLDELRAAGLPLQQSSDGRCRLPWPLELLDTARIRGALAPHCAVHLDVLWRPESTSDVVRRHLTAADHAQPVAVVAESQSAGRGRRGKRWRSPPGLNVCLSIGRRMPGNLERMAGLSLAVGVQLLQALADVGCTGAMLKWPNDVQLDGAKLAGVLVEAERQAQDSTRVVVGIGLNLRLPPHFAGAIGQPSTDLAGVMAAGPPSRNTMVAALIRHVVEGLDAFASAGFAPFADSWRRHDLLQGQALTVSTGAGEWQGQGAGVDARGRLRVRRGDEVVVVDSGDVSIRKRDAAA